MIVSRPDIIRFFLLPLLAAAVVSSAPLYATQDSEEDADTADTEQSQPKAGETPAVAPQSIVPQTKVKKAKDTKNLYFLGARPNLRRQQGPAIGAPVSILPQPYVPKGSVQIPPAPVTGEVEDQSAGFDSVVEEEAGESRDASSDLPEPPAEDAEIIADEKAAGEEADLVSSPDSLLEAGALEQLDPSGIAVDGMNTSETRELWRGYGRDTIIKRLAEFAETAGSPSLAKIANRIVLSGTTFEGQSSDSEIEAFVEARLDLLMRLGNAKGYTDLLMALPTSHDWSGLARHFTNAHLLSGKIGDVCELANERREHDNDAYWLRMIAFCDAARGNRNGVDFQLRILEEVSDVQPTFYQLIDQILVEAEQPPGGVLSANTQLRDSLRIDVLEATMARLARVEIAQLAPENINPLAIGLMLSLPNVSADAKTELMGLAVRRGWADGKLLAAFARTLSSDLEKETAALQLLEEDDRFAIDAVLVKIAATPAADAERSIAYGRVWGRALKNNYLAVAGESLLELSRDLVPKATSGGVVTRAALITGNTGRAADWFAALRSQAAGADARLDAELISVAPLMALAAPGGGVVLTPDLLSRWWRVEADHPDRFKRANLLFTIAEALGHTVGDEAWVWLEEGPTAFGGAVPATAPWRRLLISAHEGDTPKTLALAFRLLAEGGTAGVPATLAGSLVGTLAELGMQNEARMIATEILISQGL